MYNDAKSSSLSAYSWPSRIVAGELASRFDYNKPFENYTASSFDLQYVHLGFHRELLTSIVQSHLSTFRAEIQQCLAASILSTIDTVSVYCEWISLCLRPSHGRQARFCRASGQTEVRAPHRATVGSYDNSQESTVGLFLPPPGSHTGGGAGNLWLSRNCCTPVVWL